MTEVKRDSGLDIVRTVAVFFVISVHFFMYTGFYEKPLYGELLYIQTAMRWLFYTCVPLFIILTGYLKSKKKIDKNHYKSIIHILISYLFASICVILFRKLYLHDEATMFELIHGIFNFTTDSYAWYIEMYIGLFLLIPFLNIIYNNINKKQKHILIFTLFFLTSISSMGYGIKISGTEFLDILPNWWYATTYPIMYYFIGCYIKEYQIEISKFKNIFLIIFVLLVQTTLSYSLTYGEVFNSRLWNFYGNIFTATLAVLIFILLYKINIKNKKINFIIRDISILSLDIYLLSYISDNIFYQLITPHVQDYRHFIFLFFIIVPTLFIFNYILAIAERLIINAIKFFKKKITKKQIEY